MEAPKKNSYLIPHRQSLELFQVLVISHYAKSIPFNRQPKIALFPTLTTVTGCYAAKVWDADLESEAPAVAVAEICLDYLHRMQRLYQSVRASSWYRQKDVEERRSAKVPGIERGNRIAFIPRI